MSIPEEIRREHVEQAIALLDQGRDHPFGTPTRYAVVHAGKLYPPKALVGVAAELATGRALSPSDFSGGNAQGQANSILRELGFEVVDKVDENKKPAETTTLQQDLELLLREYVQARQSTAFSNASPMVAALSRITSQITSLPAIRKHPSIGVQFSAGKGNWARVPWIMIHDRRETTTARRGRYGVFLFRQDMTGVYLTLNQGITELQDSHGRGEARKILKERARSIRETVGELSERFRLDDGIDLHTDAALGEGYEDSTIAYKLYDRGAVPSDSEIIDDISLLVEEYLGLLGSSEAGTLSREATTESVTAGIAPSSDFDIAQATGRLIRTINDSGFFFEPWQIATYVTAVRTKPFVILAGVAGTGKSKLPVLVSRSTGGVHQLVPVRPDWTDSSDVIGYSNLEGRFQPGQILRVAREASNTPDVYHTCVIDEMNLARVEQYFAEVLSRIEERETDGSGIFASRPLLSSVTDPADQQWAEVTLPSNLALVGTVNMDESAHGFSRKVLDRAFTIELSDIRLDQWQREPKDISVERWSISAWRPRGIRLSELTNLSPLDVGIIETVISTLNAANEMLAEAQLQVGYRTRDEVALFLLHAAELRNHFRTTSGEDVDPLDLALQMKVLPRIIGGSAPVRRSVMQMLGWAATGKPFDDEQDATDLVELWRNDHRAGRIIGAPYPRTAARLALMWERFSTEGFTSFWL